MSNTATVNYNEAIPKGRPRTTVIKGRLVTFTPSRTREATNAAKLFIKKAWGRRKPSEKRFFVEMRFACRSKRTDGDNLEKLLLDAAEGIIFENDCQVETVVRRKTQDTKNPETIATFVELEDSEDVRISWEVYDDTPRG